MFDWLGNVWDSIVGTTSTIDWGSVGTSALTTTILGAGIGALTSAVSKGDIKEGLLFGAAGGLVVGGLSEFGGQFYNNWTWSGSQAATDGAFSVDNYSLSDMGFDDNEMSLVSNYKSDYDLNLGDLNTQAATGSSDIAKLLNPGAVQTGNSKGWGEILGPSALNIGGKMLIGAMTDPEDDPSYKQVALNEKIQAESEAGKKRAASALNSVKVAKGSFVEKDNSSMTGMDQVANDLIIG